MQQYTLEYRVSGTVDGVTPSPVFSVDPLSPDFKEPDADGIYRFEVEELGYIDPDFDAGGSQGDRFVRGVLVDGPNPSPFALIGVLAFFDNEEPQAVVPLEAIASLETGQFRLPKGCIFVPQGGVIGAVGLQGNGASDPVIIRISIDIPDSTTEYAEMLQACCCESGQQECEPTEIADVSPSSFFPFQTPLTVTVTGSGFVEGVTQLTVEGQGSINIDNFVVNSPTEVQFDVLSAQVGGYQVFLTNGEGCSSIGGFLVSQPA